MFYVYEIYNRVTNYTYVGYTSDVKARWKEHKNDLLANRHHNIHLQRAWNKYSPEVFEWRTVKEYNSKESAILLEIELIEKLDRTYNIAAGGLGGRWNKNITQDRLTEIKRAASERNLKRYENPEERLKCNVFLNLTEEERQARLEVWSNVKIGNKNSRYKYDKPVLQLDKNTGEVVREWVDVSEAGRSGYERRYILACCKGKKGYSSHKGYIWKWKE